MRVLVTGSAGFIGTHLVQKLVSEGHDVIGLDDLSVGTMAAVDRIVGPYRFVHADLRESKELDRVLLGVEAVFHQAAIASVPASFDDPFRCMSVNSAGSAQLFDAARRAGVRRIIMASTSAIYGDDSGSIKHESMTPFPLSPYAVSKLAMENLADVYAREYGMEMIALRYFNVYGDGQPAEGGYAAVVPAILKSILTGTAMKVFGDGHQTRSFIHVADIVRANLAAASAGLAPQDGVLIANLANKEVVSLNKLIETFETVIGESIPVEFLAERDGDIRHSAGDTTLARERLDFTAAIDLREGVSQLLDSWSVSRNQ